MTEPLADPQEFADGGQELFESLSTPADSFEMTALITEAARIKDRLDRLHRTISGDEDVWFRLVPARGDGDVLEVRVDSALTEARQLATVFRQMLAEIKKRRDDDGGNPDEYDPLDDL
ncbi:hypothetical protein [Hoyosella altamirensis]|uniref:hypothetical protein n=1 Tax=Hoyosella altamirensis TaxID=616997 RepID=UPI001E5C3D3D|nr:hypothetical protein [Hoyosella altamirensis]